MHEGYILMVSQNKQVGDMGEVKLMERKVNMHLVHPEWKP